MREIVLGKELKIGDVIETWWAPNRDTILSLETYIGPLTCFPEGAQIAGFAMNASGMTIENGMTYSRISKGLPPDAA